MRNLTLTTLVAAMIISLTAMAFTTPKKADPQTNRTNTNVVSYVVNVDNTYAHGFCGDYYVMVTMPCGNPIAPPKLFVEGVGNYVFQEEGTVSGNRVAKLVQVSSQSTSVCPLQVYTQPVSQPINYSNNTLSMFFLYPQLVPGDE